MARYSHNCTFLEEISFKQHEKIQISLSLVVQFSEPVAKIHLLLNLQLRNFLNNPTEIAKNNMKSPIKNKKDGSISLWNY